MQTSATVCNCRVENISYFQFHSTNFIRVINNHSLPQFNARTSKRVESQKFMLITRLSKTKSKLAQSALPMPSHEIKKESARA